MNYHHQKFFEKREIGKRERRKRVFLRSPPLPSSSSSPPPFSHLSFSPQEINKEEAYNGQLAYGQSKLANVLFTLELAERERESGSNVLVNAIHPGEKGGKGRGRGRQFYEQRKLENMLFSELAERERGSFKRERKSNVLVNAIPPWRGGSLVRLFFF